jgi:hypothetical protein
MTFIRGLAISVFAAGALMLPAAQDEAGNVQIAGQWSLMPAQTADKVRLTLHWKSGRHGMNSTMEWSLNRIEGLTVDQMRSAGTTVQFRIKREAGTLNCDGYLKSGGGGGVFSFVVNRSFVNEMSSLGYSGLRDHQLLAMAVHEVTTAYVRDIRAEGIAVGNADQLLAMRIHDVEVAYVREMKQLGFSDLSSDKLVAMRIHGVQPGFARELKQRGYNAVSTDQLISMRIHGASVDFVKQLDDLGYKHPSIDQLVSMRIHGVTPEVIRKLQQRGLKDLTIDKLISMRIHGLVN